MGEYALFNGVQVKIGTCESMYYLRFADRNRVQPVSNSLNPATTRGLFWRLPFPDEDDISPGHYESYTRGVRLYRVVKDAFGRERPENYEDESLAENTGIVQLTHPCGLLVNVTCYHGVKLPNNSEDVGFHWNGRAHFLELQSIKELADGTLKPIIACRHCRSMWRADWPEIRDYVPDEELRARLDAMGLQ